MSQVLSLSERFRSKNYRPVFRTRALAAENGSDPAFYRTWSSYQSTILGATRVRKDLLSRSISFLFSCPHVDFIPQNSMRQKLSGLMSGGLPVSSDLFWIDEIHRLTRPQDLLLRAVEDGTIVVVAATTENPSFVLSSALLSRMNVLTFSR